MVVPKNDLQKIRWFCQDRIPIRVQVQEQVWLELDIAPTHVTIMECQLPCRTDGGPGSSRFPIARLRYAIATKTWTLLCRDHNLTFHHYYPQPPSKHIEDLLAEIARDPTGIFWD